MAIEGGVMPIVMHSEHSTISLAEHRENWKDPPAEFASVAIRLNECFTFYFTH